MRKGELRRDVLFGMAGLGGVHHLSRAAVAAPVARQLFNGRDLSGWKLYANGIWEVKEGAILCRYDKTKIGPGYLFTEDEFGDFDLSLAFWVSKGGNSGVFVRQRHREIGPRGASRPGHSPGDGVEVQIDYNDPKNLTGAIYDRRKPDHVVGGEERWNRYRIRCVGDRVQVWVDDEKVNDFAGLEARRGAIGLQMHGGQPHHHIVKFRDLKIVELGAQETSG